ncbi:NAD(+) diphosphatase [Chitinimonas lacunae]|uniref:NAD(+) diphosphatase n=1 Tax=Chitinimonas lacunae TaxID=1963018 RepID=A0ABV8MJK1_9NEIS
MPDFQPAVIIPATPSLQLYRFAFIDGRLLLDEEGRLAPILAAGLDLADAHYLGRLGEHDCWACQMTEVPAGLQATALRAAMMKLPAELAALAGRAAQVLEWDRSHRFCGTCATPTQLKVGERARLCPACGQLAYPRLSPAMMALVVRGRELLLARSPHFPPGVYSALAGFVEPGESVEECVAREVAEEVGLRINRPRYFGSQSWPFPHSLMLAFVADWESGDIVPQPEEIEDARWFTPETLPTMPPSLSIAGRLIRAVVAELEAR